MTKLSMLLGLSAGLIGNSDLMSNNLLSGAVLPRDRRSKLFDSLVARPASERWLPSLSNRLREPPQIYTVDWKALERNKYAPWGRGWLGGQSVVKNNGTK